MRAPSRRSHARRRGALLHPLGSVTLLRRADPLIARCVIERIHETRNTRHFEEVATNDRDAPDNNDSKEDKVGWTGP